MARDREMDAQAFMNLGLSLFFSEDRIGRARDETNIERFRQTFGVDPPVVAFVWSDLMKYDISVEGANLLPLPANKRKPVYFLMALYTLKKYPTESDRESRFDVSATTAREWTRYYLERIQALQVVKITWPSDEELGNDTWVMTVDGTHCWINEPQHPEWSIDTTFWSHKYAKAGVNYEIGISLNESRIIWMNGPFKAGTPDVKIFATQGLKERLLAVGRKAIGDKGYKGHQEVISTYNSHDSRPVTKFKSRALKRHEYFNNMLKRYECLQGRFRHNQETFATMFESICVLCQYQMELTNDKLYDVLIEDVMREK